MKKAEGKRGGVGGSKGEMKEILRLALKKNPAVRLCVSCIALETLETVLAFCREQGLTPMMTQLAVSEAQPVGGLHLMMAQNPIFLATVQCDD